jgi:hypothetical protein
MANSFRTGGRQGSGYECWAFSHFTMPITSTLIQSIDVFVLTGVMAVGEVQGSTACHKALEE